MSCRFVDLELSGVIAVNSIKVELMACLVVWIALDVPLSTLFVHFMAKVLEKSQRALVIGDFCD